MFKKKVWNCDVIDLYVRTSRFSFIPFLLFLIRSYLLAFSLFYHSIIIKNSELLFNFRNLTLHFCVSSGIYELFSRERFRNHLLRNLTMEFLLREENYRMLEWKQ